MEKAFLESLPIYDDAILRRPWIDRRRKRKFIRFIAVACLAYVAFSTYKIANNTEKPGSLLSFNRLRDDYATCASLRRAAMDPSGTRDYNKRWTNGTKPLLIRNATVWIGEPADGTTEGDSRLGKGWSWIASDIFVDRGLILKVEKSICAEEIPDDTTIFEAHGRQLTAGIVDMHSHAGLSSVGNLQDDVNEMSNDITPYVRSIDGVDPLQPEFEYIKSGGVTTSLFLPGSGNNVGGEAYVLKLAVGEKNGRTEISQQDLIADPDQNWRYMKMACGENPKRVYGKRGEHGPFSRLGEAWSFRHALEQARNYVRAQDDWCKVADSVGAENMATYLPQSLEWEPLGAVLRGQVRINTHCYTIPDLEAFVRHTNEFKFRVYAFHHAHQTFLIPEVLKRAWGGAPAVALFADNMYYKVEAYTASEKAGAFLYAHNITPTYVSDNPVLNSQHVIFEAAKAYGYGLPYHAALSGMTSAPAELLGLGKRIGKIKPGFDADIVVWDSDPLSVGAAPVQVWIDGAPQFKDPVRLKKPLTPPIEPDSSLKMELKRKEVRSTIVFTGISYSYMSKDSGEMYPSEEAVAIIEDGRVLCIGFCVDELAAARNAKAPQVALKNGYVTPPFTAFGSGLGLVEIDAESDTKDGRPMSEGVSRAVDGLAFGGRQLARAFEHGITKAVTAPNYGSIDGRGISVGFKTGAQNALEEGAIWKEEASLHYILSLSAKGGNVPSISSAINSLRGKLLDAVHANKEGEGKSTSITKDQYEEPAYLKRVVSGTLPLVLSAHSADTIAAIIRLKYEIETALASPFKLRITVIGGAESYLVAKELASANISVVLAPLLPHAQTWDQRRGLTGAPLTNGTNIDVLLDAGVLVGIGVEETWETRDLGLLAGIAYANGEGRLSYKEALDLVGRNIDRMMGLEKQGNSESSEWVIWEGSPLEIGGRVRALNMGKKSIVWQ